MTGATWLSPQGSPVEARAAGRRAAQAGAVEPLVQLLRDAPGEIAAELAAVVLRNLASGSAASRRAIVDAAGLWPLLSLLAMGQEKLVYPMACQVARSLTGCPAACGRPSCALQLSHNVWMASPGLPRQTVSHRLT